MSIDIVIAHYKEDIEWLNDEKLSSSSIKNIYLYTKNSDYRLSDKLKNNSKIKHYHLPNIGRESHTYLTYCIDHYNDQHINTVIFLQGNPFVHGVNINKILSWIQKSTKNTQFFSQNFTNSFLLKGLRSGHINYWQGNTEKCDLSVQDWFIKNIQKSIPRPLKIYFCANFAIPHSKIRTRNISHYKNLIDQYFVTKNPETAHFIERSWFYLFNLNKTNL